MDGIKRLSRDTTYERPKKTYQEMLSNEEINTMIIQFIGVHINFVLIKIHVNIIMI